MKLQMQHPLIQVGTILPRTLELDRPMELYSELIWLESIVIIAKLSHSASAATTVGIGMMKMI